MDHSDRECPGCVELALYDCLFHGSGAGSVTGCHVHVTAGGCWADLGHNLCTPSGFFGLTYFLDGLWRDLDPLSGVVVRYSIVALNNSLFFNDPAFPVDKSAPAFRKAVAAHEIGHAIVLKHDYSGIMRAARWPPGPPTLPETLLDEDRFSRGRQPRPRLADRS